MYIHAESVECSDGALRLVSESGVTTDSGVGRLEICFQGVWGAVYDANWTAVDAAVTCRELGFDPRGGFVVRIKQSCRSTSCVRTAC